MNLKLSLPQILIVGIASFIIFSACNLMDEINEPTVEITGDFIDERDGKKYSWVQIGYQIWMSENLNFQMDNGSVNIDGDPHESSVYGSLYTYEAALVGCPDGWHLPDNDEWQTIYDYLGGDHHAGIQMKTTGNLADGTGLWISEHFSATNSSGFSAIPAGLYQKTGGSSGFHFQGEMTAFWSSTAIENDKVWIYELEDGPFDNYLNTDNYNEDRYFSVRCIQD